jgi:hypothetical protein
MDRVARHRCIMNEGDRGKIRAHPSDRAARLRPQPPSGVFAKSHPLRGALHDYAGAFIMAVFFALALAC